jgi:hypothetical protein
MMRYAGALVCLLAGCHAFQPIHLLRPRALVHTSCLASTTGSEEGASGNESTLRTAVDAVDIDRLTSFAQSE